MELIINYPTTENGIKLFQTEFSKFQAKLVMKCIDDISKKKVLNGIIETIDNESKKPIEIIINRLFLLKRSRASKVS